MIRADVISVHSNVDGLNDSNEKHFLRILDLQISTNPRSFTLKVIVLITFHFISIGNRKRKTKRLSHSNVFLLCYKNGKKTVAYFCFFCLWTNNKWYYSFTTYLISRGVSFDGLHTWHRQSTYFCGDNLDSWVFTDIILCLLDDSYHFDGT
jgi:hypothetical protein